MQIVPIPAALIPRVWDELAIILAPAVIHDREITLGQVGERLANGEFEACLVTMPEADGIVVVKYAPSDDAVAICYLAGKSRLLKSTWLWTMRRGMREFERIARARGFRSLYVGGRDWSRIFPDFVRDPVPTDPNRLRKAL